MDHNNDEEQALLLLSGSSVLGVEEMCQQTQMGKERVAEHVPNTPINSPLHCPTLLLVR
jgi:hypothetical protein